LTSSTFKLSGESSPNNLKTSSLNNINIPKALTLSKLLSESHNVNSCKRALLEILNNCGTISAYSKSPSLRTISTGLSNQSLIHLLAYALIGAVADVPFSLLPYKFPFTKSLSFKKSKVSVSKYKQLVFEKYVNNPFLLFS
jgi:hypothetical protein